MLPLIHLVLFWTSLRMGLTEIVEFDKFNYDTFDDSNYQWNLFDAKSDNKGSIFTTDTSSPKHQTSATNFPLSSPLRTLETQSVKMDFEKHTQVLFMCVCMCISVCLYIYT